MSTSSSDGPSTPDEASPPEGSSTPAVPVVAQKTRDDLSHLEIFAVLLIALTAVLTAWSAFEASKWGGVMSIKFSEANATRTESVRLSDEANRQLTIDVSLFTSYANAFYQGDQEEADFVRQRFPDRLDVATDAWEATDPLTSADAPETPFDMAEYVLAPADRAAELQAEADQRATEAREANQNGDNYTITSVLFATVILLAALSSKVRRLRTARLLIGLSVAVLACSVAVIATYPIKV